MTQSINKKFQEFFSEAVQDKGIFKAVFLVGSPGSGKDFVLKNVFKDTGLVEVTSDKILSNLGSNKEVKSLHDIVGKLALDGRNGLIINDTGEDHQKIKEIKNKLESIGYSLGMVLVYTDDETSRQRNNERYQRGARAIPESSRQARWKLFQEARQIYSRMFSGSYFEFDNSVDLRQADPVTVMNQKQQLEQIKEQLNAFVIASVENPKAQKWIQKEVEVILTQPVKQKGTDKLPNTKSNANQRASELGLRYFSSGRYGKGNKVTHYTINDTLQEIPNNALTESVSVKFEADTPEELGKFMGKFSEFSKSINLQVSESNPLSVDTPDFLTLGKPVEVFDLTGINNINESIDFSSDQKESTRPKTLKSFLESIDKGIEPGLSMSTGGEGVARAAPSKKKKTIPLEYE